MSGASATIDRSEGQLGALVSLDEASKRLRIVDAALRCVRAKGLRGTTVEEIASEAGMARATLYRAFPGGRESVLRAVTETETARFFSSLAVDLAAASDLAELLVTLITGSARRLDSSVMVAALWREQPDVVLSRLAFSGMDETLALASDFSWPFFAQWMGEDPARRAGELVARVILSYLMSPEPGIDLTDEVAVGLLVERHVLAGVEALAA